MPSLSKKLTPVKKLGGLWPDAPAKLQGNSAGTGDAVTVGNTRPHGREQNRMSTNMTAMQKQVATSLQKIKTGLGTIEKAEGKVSMNDALVIGAFASRGIEATPRVDVWTSNAWIAKGRKVKQTELRNGVRITTFYKDSRGEKHRRLVTVYHVSQTEPLADGDLDCVKGKVTERKFKKVLKDAARAEFAPAESVKFADLPSEESEE